MELTTGHFPRVYTGKKLFNLSIYTGFSEHFGLSESTGKNRESKENQSEFTSEHIESIENITG